MTETSPPAPELEALDREPASRRLSLVWLIPLVALVLSLGVAWRSYSERGPLIEITFNNAAGIAAGKTTLRFRDVTVGTVEKLALTPDLRRVVASVRVDKDVAGYIDGDARFWVVRPSVNAQGISGLETVISGVYIGAFWDDQPGEPVSRFDALPRPPLTPADQPGLRVRLRAPEGGSVSVGSPVLFKRIQVGKVENVELTPAGDVVLDLFIDAPNDARISEGTRFWNASGFNVSVGPQGAQLNVESLVALLQGGVAFDEVAPGAKVRPGHIFQLYASETLARQNVFEEDTGFRQHLTVYFDGSVRGLQAGAPVEFRGVTVGEVTGIEAALLEGERGPKVALRTTLSLTPQRFGIDAGSDAVMARQMLDLIESEVNRGMRAQLATSGLLGQSLHVDLAMMDNAPPGELNRHAAPYPVLPSAPTQPSGVASSAQGLMQRLSSLPIEDLMRSAQALLGNINALVTSDSVKAAPENLGLAIADLRKLIAAPGVQQAPDQLAAILASVQGITDEVKQQQLVARLGATLDAAKLAIDKVGDVTGEQVPQVVAEINALSARLRDLPLEDLLASGNKLLASLDALVQSDGVQNLPGSLDATVAELRANLAALRDGGAIDNANATLASVRQIADEVARSNLTASIQQVAAEAQAAVGNLNTATNDLPQLMASLRALSDKAAQLPLDQLVAAGTDLLSTADGFLKADGMDQVPASLTASLDALRQILVGLKDGGAVDNLNTTLASADKAAAALSDATTGLPGLITELSEVAARADATLASVGPDSQVNRETLALLRQIRDSARSVQDLAQALQRQPNSVLFGR